jgi:uncharacterized damage-inducible protein DinB
MSGTLQMRDYLLQELDLVVRTTGSLIARIGEGEWAYRPQANMRSLLELVHHLVAIPASDLAILQESSEPEVAAIENASAGIADRELLVQRLKDNCELFKRYVLSLSEEELLNKSTKAYYLDHGAVQAKWLIEVVTHMFHHRSQLYNYLKQNGHDVQFFILYA